jgi:amino acid adenylation domain-containing protein/thioester reductase-like protein
MQAAHHNIVQLFFAVADQCPGRTAIKDSNRSLTYQELRLQASSAANKLRHHNVSQGDRIVIVSKKDAGSVICFWAVLLSGGIPVIVDHEDGIKVNEAKTSGIRPRAIIYDAAGHGIFPSKDTSVCLFEFKDLLQPDPGAASNGEVPDLISDICYILLTSGTTGKPKAVQVSHDNVLHYTYAMYDRIGRPDNVHAAHVSTFAADLGLTNLLMALVSGGMLRILNKVEATDPSLFNEIIRREKISLLKITPSHLLSLTLDREKDLAAPIDTIVLGGEKLTWQTASTFLQSGICTNLYNHYGPTETTIGALVFRIDDSSRHYYRTGSVPLGKPLGAGRCLLENLTDDTGELWIAGPGVSAGYFENEEENKKKFISGNIDNKEVLWYRTGDICRILDDGNFEFLYRNDRQVKVKGYRVELGEIELMLAAHPAIENVMVTVSVKEGHNNLDAYIKRNKGYDLTGEDLRLWLLDKAPHYKTPTGYYFYTEAPYNSNGKIDLDALKKRFQSQREETGTEDHKADTWLGLITGSWKKLLNKSEIAATDNFYEAGGDSLLAIQLIGRLQRHGYKVHITDINNNPVFRDFSRLDPPRNPVGDKAPEQGKKTDKLTFSQKRFLQQDQPDLNFYCQTILLETEDKIKVREMAHALTCVIESHTQLATAFRRGMAPGNGKRGQNPAPALGTTILDSRSPVSMQIYDTVSILLKEIAVDKGRLFLAHVFVDPQGKDYLCLMCHHLVVDVISWNIILDELTEYYEQLLHNNFPVIKPENIVGEFYHTLPKTLLDADRYKPAVHKIYRLPGEEINDEAQSAAEVYHLLLPKEISGILHNLDEQGQSLSPSGLLLSAFGTALLWEFSLQEITVDVEFHGRPQQQELPDLSRSVSWWSTTFPVDLASANASPEYCSGEIEERAALANTANLHPERYLGLQAVTADVRFNYLGHFPEEFGNASIKLRPSLFNPGATRSLHAQQEYKIYFTARIIGDILNIDIQYQTLRFPRTRMDNIARRIRQILMDRFGKESAGYPPLRLPSMLTSNIPSVGQPLYHLQAGHPALLPAARTVFLTGATGFLGAHLLRELTRQEHLNIFCLVRADSQRQAADRLESCFQYYFKDLPEDWAARVHALKGDLADEDMGLSTAGRDRLVRDVDIILHTAADVNLTKDDSELTATNIIATRRILDLAAAAGNKTVHYVSTLAVSGCPPDGGSRDFSEDDFDYGQFFISGYEKTKFASENLVREYLKNGGNGAIYRVGHIAADSVSGRFQRNIEQNRIFQIIKGIMLLKMIPDSYTENISFSYVDIVANGIARLSLEKTGKMSCWHLDSPYYLSFLSIGEMLTSIGYDIEVVDISAFRQAVINFDGRQNEKKAVELMYNWIQRYMDYPRRVNYLQKRSLDTIARTGLYFRMADLEWFSAMIREGIKAGYFPSVSQTLFYAIQ